MFGLTLLGLVGLFWACEKDNAADSMALADEIALSTAKEAIDIASLPAAISAYIADTYAPLTAESAWYVAGAGYEVALEDGGLLYFSEENTCLERGPRAGRRGGCLHGDTLSLDSLLQTIADYVAANYPDATIQVAVSKRDGAIYAVQFSDGVVLLFDAAGAYLRECMGGPGSHPQDSIHHDSIHHDSFPHDTIRPNGGGPRGGCLAGDTLTTADVPQAALDYIAANYPDLTVQTVVSKADGAVLAVELSDGVVLLFDAEGAFVKICGVRGNGGGHGPGNGGGHGGHGGGHGGGRG